MISSFFVLAVLIILSYGASNTVLTQQNATPSKVVRTVPDISKKVPTALKEIRVVFNQRMIGVDVAYGGTPVGDVRWEDDNTTHVISFNGRLSPSKIYRLILGRNQGYQNMAGVPLEEYVLTFTTEGPEPVTPTFIDTTPIDVTDVERLDLSEKLLCRVSDNPTVGFNFPYYLLIPQGINLGNPIYLLVEPNNTGVGSSFKSLDRNAKESMRYPVGIADVKEVAGIDFDEATYKEVSQYIYMGALDDNDTVPYRDAYDDVDAELVKSLIGAKMMPDRWDMSQSIYKALEIPAQFVTYENTRHEIKDEMIDDIAAFFEANAADEIVEIVPHQYPSAE